MPCKYQRKTSNFEPGGRVVSGLADTLSAWTDGEGGGGAVGAAHLRYPPDPSGSSRSPTAKARTGC
jgi:hypothetical protein